ncbi:MAG TPA: GlxA family transcriptional regulator [Terriglobia bacterium]
MAAQPRQAFSTKKTIGILGYDGVQALDIVGPMDAFSIASSHLASKRPDPAPAYEVLVLGLSRRAFVAESGIAIRPHRILAAAPPLDTVIVPGGKALRLHPATNARVAHWLRTRAPRIRRVASVCTGIYALAPTGLLDGRRVTTHWRFTSEIARLFPKLRLDPNPLFIKDDQFYTSAGITAGIDLALALIEEDHGPQIALAVARDLVVYLKRPGGQEQYSEPLRFQMNSNDRLSDLAPWITTHLHQDLSVETLAAKACLSPRQFTRRFKSAFGVTPGEFVENLRLDEARRRLSSSSVTIEGVGDSVGFASADSFRRAFERHFGIAPSIYRGRFSAA